VEIPAARTDWVGDYPHQRRRAVWGKSVCDTTRMAPLERLARWLPRPAVAVLAGGVGGAALPGCECGSVPAARHATRSFVQGCKTAHCYISFGCIVA
jgi:hypothetical protein